MSLRLLFAAATALTLIAPLPAFADATVNVSLSDTGADMDLSQNMGLGLGLNGDMSKAMMFVKADVQSIAAGKVTLVVTNDAKETLHELLVAPVADVNVILPYVENENRVDEEAAKYLGEVSELEPGKSGSLTLELTSGLYLLFCNVPGHYQAGMWTLLKVE